MFFTPAKLGKHRLYFTCAWTLVLFITFFYTIGEFPYYQGAQWADATVSACLANATATPMSYGPSQMEHWITTVRSSCAHGCVSSFPFCWSPRQFFQVHALHACTHEFICHDI